MGTPVAYTGLVWTGFRPSDDAARYQFNIPDNMFAVVVLRDLTEIEQNVYRDKRLRRMRGACRFKFSAQSSATG